MTNKSTMTNIRIDYADKRWLCPDEIAEPIARMVVCTIVCAALWLYDVSVWSVYEEGGGGG